MRLGAAAGLGLVEQPVDLGQLLEHVGAVLRELGGTDIQPERTGGASRGDSIGLPFRLTAGWHER